MAYRLVARVEQDATCQINPFAHAGGNKDLTAGVIDHAVQTIQVLGDRLTEGGQPVVGGVFGPARLDRHERRLDVGAPAVVAAIHDATGVWIHDLPASPERVLAAITGAPTPPPPGVSAPAAERGAA